jgi:hypothetical protein
MLPGINRLLGFMLALIGIAITSACVPMSSTYERIDAPDAIRYKNICRGSIGPPSTVYYPFHGIYISLNFSSTTLGLHIPEGMTASLADNTIKIEGESKSGHVQKIVHFKAFKPGAAGNNDPPDFSVTAPYTSPDYLGPLEGRSVGNRYVYYFFMGVDEVHANRMVSLPFDLIEGTIELPAININGERYDPQDLTFKQTKYFEISPINC